MENNFLKITKKLVPKLVSNKIKMKAILQKEVGDASKLYIGEVDIPV
jgi:hypothetical protein